MTRYDADVLVTQKLANGGWSSMFSLVSSLSVEYIYDWLGEDIGEDEKIEE